MRASLLICVLGCGGSAAPATTTPTTPAPAYTVLDRAPADAIAFDVRLIRWACEVTEVHGTSEENLHVPIGRAVALTLHNADKEDLDVELLGSHTHVASGQTVKLAFRVDRTDTYSWQCPTQMPPNAPTGATTHSLIAMTPDAWDALQKQLAAVVALPETREDKLALGRRLYEKKGCNNCHTIDGTPRVGPSWKGIWGKPTTLADGTTRTVDAAYVHESIIHPQAFARPGYPPVMPSFEGQLKPFEIEALVMFIESLAN